MKAPSTIARTASGAAMPLSGRAKAKLRMLLPFRVRTAAPASLRNSAAEKVLGLAAADEEQAFGFQASGAMQQRGFERLGGDFAAGNHVLGGFAHGGIGAFEGW